MSNLGRPRGDLWEVALYPRRRGLNYTYQVFNQAIEIPESIDAIRALSDTEPDAARSIAKTASTLGLRRNFLHSPSA
jgi:glyceraldehyde-3-phosphate dehydrogenase (NAD(P))